ncbi:MAG TPA: hypothetical protein VNT99_18740 [Methylomirabilota bacterium]|nr:hypothetical protein [Methylomirabilota bacterium]
MKGVWFSMGWSNGVASAPPTHFFQIRQLTQTLALKSLFEAEQQNSRTAVDALSAGFNVAGTLNTDSLASTMMRVAILGMMCEASEQVLNRTKATDVQLLSLQQSIHPARSDDFAYAFTTERCLATTMFDSLRAAHDGGGSELLFLMRLARWMSGDRKPIYRDEDYLAYLNFLDEHRAAQSLPGFERLGRSKQLNALLKTNTYSTMLEIIAPNWTRAMHAAIEAGARLEAAKAALAVERYRLAHNGELPDSWSALVPMYLTAAPRDPLDHQPLRFKKLSRGYIVYSIGADGVDNGGGERANHTVTNHYDVTFTVER